MKREDDLELAVRQAYVNAPVPDSLTAAARALLDAEGTPRTSSTASEPLTVRAPRKQDSRRRAVLAAVLIAAGVAAVAILTTNLAAPHNDSDAAPTVAIVPPSATAERTSTSSAASTQASPTPNPDMNLLRAMATGVIVNPAAGSPTDNSTVVDALNWTFIRSRTVSAPIADVIAWYETNIRAPEASQPPTLIDSTLHPAGRTPELAAAENAFVRPQVTIRFTEITDTSTRVDVIATGYHRDERPENPFIPAAQIAQPS